MSRFLAVALLAAGAVAVPGEPEKLHRDPAALERGIQDAVLAYTRNEPDALRAALDRVGAACRRAGPAEAEVFGGKVRALDSGFHTDLDTAREWTSRGDMERAWASLHGAIQACRTCHAEARSTAP